jgi:hypothetical protein
MKRNDNGLLNSTAHLIEIDLLRSDMPMPMDGVEKAWDYRILVSRSEQRPVADLYGFNLREPIPRFPLPLQAEDNPPTVDLQTLLSVLYDEAGYQYRLGYQRPVPPPALSFADQQWVDELLAPLRGQ